jgi:hypothetical protein
LRFTAADVHRRPDVVVAQVREALATPPSARLAPNARNTRSKGAPLASDARNRAGVTAHLTGRLAF